MKALFVLQRNIRRATLGAACLAMGLAITGCGEVKEVESYISGMESYVYGYPIVMMDVTREVLTAAPAPDSEGTANPPIRKVQ